MSLNSYLMFPRLLRLLYISQVWLQIPMAILYVSTPSDHLALGTISEEAPPTISICHNAHRRLAFPTDVVAALAPPEARFDQTVANQDAIHRRLRRRSAALRGGVGQLMGDPPGPPAGGCSQRSSHTLASTSALAWCEHESGRWVRSINPPRPSRA
jgi:hypothetical protein